MYRPTVRYDDVFRTYVDNLFKTTHLDRNQIIRAALFAAAHSKEFRELMELHKKKDVPLPSPVWTFHNHAYWLEQCPQIGKEGRDVNAKHSGNSETSEATRNLVGGHSKRGSEERTGRFEQAARRDGAVPFQRITIRDKGGITFKIN